MSNDTHINAFKQDAKDALAKAHAALGDAEKAVDELINKVQSDNTDVQSNAVIPPTTVNDNNDKVSNPQPTVPPNSQTSDEVTPPSSANTPTAK